MEASLERTRTSEHILLFLFSIHHHQHHPEKKSQLNALYYRKTEMQRKREREIEEKRERQTPEGIGLLYAQKKCVN